MDISPTEAECKLRQAVLDKPASLFEVRKLEALKDLKIKFRENFQNNHSEIIPLSKSFVKEYCASNKINFNELRYNNDSKMVNNACMAPECSFFLKPSASLHKHLGTWQGKCPIGFHLIVRSNLSKSPEEILNLLISGGDCHVRRKQPLSKLFPQDKDFALSYISKVKDAYCNIQSNP